MNPTGYYYDPKHGGCLRRIRNTGPDEYIIDGVYGRDEQPRTGRYWHATVRAQGTHLDVHFDGKCKLRKHYTARLRNRSILWDDANVWIRLYVHPKQLLTE